MYCKSYLYAPAGTVFIVVAVAEIVTLPTSSVTKVSKEASPVGAEVVLPITGAVAVLEVLHTSIRKVYEEVAKVITVPVESFNVTVRENVSPLRHVISNLSDTSKLTLLAIIID